MAENSRIEWTDHTFNPWMGCTKVSAGCKNCYAENQMDHRWNKVQWGPGKPRVRTSEAMWRKPLAWNAAAAKAGIRPRVFSASLGDWLDPEVPIEWLADLLALIHATPNLDWLLLTKRPESWKKRLGEASGHLARAASDAWLPLENWLAGIDGTAPWPNVWLGTSVEHQEAADMRIPELLKIPAAVRFLSCEPLLGPVDLSSGAGVTYWDDPCAGIHWVICGGESGANARPMHPDWARGLRDQCNAAGVPFFFKQWGEWAPGENNDGPQIKTERVASLWNDQWHFYEITPEDGENLHCDDEPDVWRFGKKATGRHLDGREWNEVPEVNHG